jgi:hypothetical protein
MAEDTGIACLLARKVINARTDEIEGPDNRVAQQISKQAPCFLDRHRMAFSRLAPDKSASLKLALWQVLPLRSAPRKMVWAFAWLLLPPAVPRSNPTAQKTEAFWDNGVAIIVNDKSPDKTGEVAETLKNRWPGLDVLHHKINRGYGGAQKTGLKRGLDLGAGVFAIVHSDGQYAPELVLDLMKPILERKAQIVQGSRTVGGGALRGVPKTMFSRKRKNTVRDVAGIRIVVAHLLGMECAQIPIPTRYDNEVSSLEPIPNGINVLKMMARHLCGHYRKLVMDKGKSSS